MTTPNGDSAPENPSGQRPSERDPAGPDEPQGEQERPRPQYGAYAPQEAGQPGPAYQPVWGQPGGSASAAPSAHDGGQYAQSPYGQNPYGQPPADGEHHTGYQPVPYGHGSPSQGEHGYAPAPVDKPKRPASLLVALLAMIGVSVAALAWGIYGMVVASTASIEELMSPEQYDMFLQEMERQAEANPELNDMAPQELLELSMTMLGGLALVWGIFVLCMYILWGFLGTMVNNACRIIATVWCALSVFMLFFGFTPPPSRSWARWLRCPSSRS
ncbi:hypothetical protein [Nesterenkonia pannonica]|uniref:hypothetical protein n=1 Tax=Nesterenkonia pannonica TaxID=1548602 RepID=UPI002164C403|nr:hypothetical protein [Nesterenkonia pannonica]